MSKAAAKNASSWGWEVERRLAEDGARPIIFYPRGGTCSPTSTILTSQIPVDKWHAGIVNLTRSSRSSCPLSLERGQPYRRAKDFSAPNRRATDGTRIPPLLKLTMPTSRIPPRQ
jgi:hypothetical protein